MAQLYWLLNREVQPIQLNNTSGMIGVQSTLRSLMPTANPFSPLFYRDTSAPHRGSPIGHLAKQHFVQLYCSQLPFMLCSLISRVCYCTRACHEPKPPPPSRSFELLRCSREQRDVRREAAAIRSPTPRGLRLRRYGATRCPRFQRLRLATLSQSSTQQPISTSSLPPCRAPFCQPSSFACF